MIEQAKHPFTDRPEYTGGPDSKVYFEGYSVRKVYEALAYNPGIVEGYVTFVNRVARRGILASEKIPIIPGEKNWTCEIRCVPVSKLLYEHGSNGVVPVTNSPRMFGPRSEDIPYARKMRKIEEEMRMFGCAEDEIKRLHTLHEAVKAHKNILEPVLLLKDEVVADLRDKYTVGLSVMPDNNRIRSETAQTLTCWITDFGVTIRNLMFNMT